MASKNVTSSAIELMNTFTGVLKPMPYVVCLLNIRQDLRLTHAEHEVNLAEACEGAGGISLQIPDEAGPLGQGAATARQAIAAATNVASQPKPECDLHLPLPRTGKNCLPHRLKINPSCTVPTVLDLTSQVLHHAKDFHNLNTANASYKPLTYSEIQACCISCQMLHMM